MISEMYVNKPIGIMGGAFNPFHYGHLRHAIEVFDRIPLTQIEILPSGQHPHKNNLLPFDIREQCILSTIQDIEFLKVNSLENNISGPSYTDKILKAWKADKPEHTPYFLLGTEDFALLPSWNNGLTLPRLAHLLIVSRHNDNASLVCNIAQKYWNEIYISHEYLENSVDYLQSIRKDSTELDVDSIKKLGFIEYLDQDLSQIEKVHLAIPYIGFCTFLNIPFLDVTATNIRNLWKNNQCIHGLLPRESIEILKKHKDILIKYW